MNYLLAISEVDDVEVFKVCLEYWNWLASELYKECPFMIGYSQPYGGYGFTNNEMPLRRKLYNDYLSRVRFENSLERF